MEQIQDVSARIMDNLRRIFQILNEESQRIKRGLGLTGPQIWTIRVLHEYGPIKISDIAKRMYLHPTTVLGIIDRLETRGLVSRTRSRDDRRVIWVELTETGRDLVRETPAVVRGLLGEKLEGISSAELGAIDAGIAQLVRVFGVQGIAPVPMLSYELKIPKRR